MNFRKPYCVLDFRHTVSLPYVLPFNDYVTIPLTKRSIIRGVQNQLPLTDIRSEMLAVVLFRTASFMSEETDDA